MIAVVRTVSPMLAGFIVSALLEWGIDLSGKPVTVSLISTLVAIVWYLVARAGEKRWPWVGSLMLGSSQQPSYPADEHEPEHAA